MAQLTTAQLWDSLQKQQATHYGTINALRAKFGQAPRQIYTTPQMMERIYSTSNNRFPLKGTPKAKSDSDGEGEDEIQLSPLEELKSQMAVQKDKIKGAGDLAPKKSWFDDFKENALRTLGRTADYVSRPGVAVTTAYGNYMGLNPYDPEDKESGDIFNALKKGIGAFTGKTEETITGKQILEDAPIIKGMSGGWQKSALTTGGGLAGDILADPTTYLSFGATSVAGQGAKKIIETTGKKILPGVTRGAEIASKELQLGQKVAGSTRKVVESELDNAAQRFAADMATDLKSPIRKQAEKDIASQIRDASKAGHKVDISTVERNAMVETRAFELADQAKDQVKLVLQTNTRRKAQVKILGKDVLRGKVGDTVGRALYAPISKGGKALNAVPGMGGLKHAFSMAEHFPGLTNRFRRVVEGRGIVQHEINSKEIDRVVEGLSRGERSALSESLERGERSIGASHNGKDLGEIYDFFDKKRRDEFATQVDLGMLHPDSDAGSRYLPQYYRGGSEKEILAHKAGRREALPLIARGDMSKYNLKAAKEAGLKPYELVDDIFKMYDADLTRKYSREMYRGMLIEQYGIKTAATEHMKKQGYADVTGRAPKAVVAKLGQGERIYMHGNLSKSLETMDNLMKMGKNDELKRFLRLTNKATNVWKQSATVYNPGNWVNNSMGDVYLNMIDGVVNPDWYRRAGRLMHNSSEGFEKIGGYQIPRQRVMQLYNDYAKGAGFLRAEVDRPLRKAGRVIPNAYQQREDFGRITHFLYSLDQELKRIPKQKGLNIDGKYFEKHLTSAAESAGERLAKWNIDYSAFTPFERQLKKFIPFYSWQRKSIPLMLEAMALHPGRVSAVNKTQAAIDEMLGGGPRGQGGDYDIQYPLWLRDAGFQRLSGGAEPTVMKNPLPSNVFGGIFTGGNWGDVYRGQLGSLHPVLQAGLEAQSGKSLLTGGNIPGGTPEFLGGKLPALATIKKLQKVAATAGNMDETTVKALMALAGSTPYDIDENRQLGELRRQQDSLEYQLKEINNQIKPWMIRKNKDGTYQAYNEQTKKKGGKYKSAEQAMANAAAMSGAR